MKQITATEMISAEKVAFKKMITELGVDESGIGSAMAHYLGFCEATVWATAQLTPPVPKRHISDVFKPFPDRVAIQCANDTEAAKITGLILSTAMIGIRRIGNSLQGFKGGHAISISERGYVSCWQIPPADECGFIVHPATDYLTP